MTISLDEKSYILGLWFTENKEGHSTLVTWYKNNKDDEWIGNVRIRKCKDNKIFDSEDEKTWYEIKQNNPASEEEIIEKMNAMKESWKQMGWFVDEIIVQGDLDKFIKSCEGKPWMNMKTEQIH